MCDRLPLDTPAVAERLGVLPATVSMWRHRGVMVAEDGTVSGQPWWWPETVDAWARETGRLAPTAG